MRKNGLNGSTSNKEKVWPKSKNKEVIYIISSLMILLSLKLNFKKYKRAI